MITAGRQSRPRTAWDGQAKHAGYLAMDLGDRLGTLRFPIQMDAWSGGFGMLKDFRVVEFVDKRCNA